MFIIFQTLIHNVIHWTAHVVYVQADNLVLEIEVKVVTAKYNSRHLVFIASSFKFIQSRVVSETK
jgi:hypothetical protein